MTLSRRAFLTRSAIIGCSAAASPLFTPMSFAAAPFDTRLVVLILRGGMDGLEVLRPVGDRDFAALGRRREDGVPLDGFYDMHPAFAPLAPMWAAGDLGFVTAVSTPYRGRRSHFDGQDLLEAGTLSLEKGQGRDGWLNRMLQVLPGVEAETTYAVGREDMLLTTGAAPVSNWAPDARLAVTPATERLLSLVTHDDPLFRNALDEALSLAAFADGAMGAEAMGDNPAVAEMMGMTSAAETRDQAMMRMAADSAAAGNDSYDRQLARFAAQKLRADTRIATFSITGWDTHAAQDRHIAKPLQKLAGVLETLREELGPVWDKTAVMAMTEFGRTVRLNGTGGTDHGTAGTLVFAGGALNGGQVHGDWPGLAEADLLSRRDLRPTADVRTPAARAMQALFGLSQHDLETRVFPGLEMGEAGRIVL